ncbi:hypothetical protein, partial [Pseudomonas viridiflava]|uniref:hypothetical protein n=1 Tax=Pseudomonas viridiflava TaxID=33069 RepID=UPI00197FA0BB
LGLFVSRLVKPTRLQWMYRRQPAGSDQYKNNLLILLAIKFTFVGARSAGRPHRPRPVTE